MTDPALVSAIDQQAASIRDLYSDFGVNLAHPAEFRAAVFTAQVLANMPLADHKTFLRCLNQVGL